MDDREILLQTRKFDVERVTFTTRDGGTATREVVSHPGAVAVLPLLDDGRVVMIRNRRFAVGKRLWELMAGTIDPGETPEQCARRELEEETGYRAGALEPLFAFYTSPGMCTERMHAFVATDLEPGEQRLERTEDIEVVPMSVERIEAMLRAGEIEDGKTAATFLYWRAFR